VQCLLAEVHRDFSSVQYQNCDLGPCLVEVPHTKVYSLMQNLCRDHQSLLKLTQICNTHFYYPVSYWSQRDLFKESLTVMVTIQMTVFGHQYQFGFLTHMTITKLLAWDQTPNLTLVMISNIS